jgi:small subunit ribosomal protein S6
MQKNKRVGLYEGMYILSSKLSEDARKQAFEKITNGIIEKEGKILKTHEMGLRKLLYKIKTGGNTFSQGYYYVLFFEAPTSAILELTASSKFNEDLIRCMTLRVEKVQETLEFKPLKETV